MRRSDDFRRAVRRGRRSGRATLVGHLLREPAASGPALVGFVVSRSVGNSVVRHRVQRRLRALVADRLPLLPEGGLLVVRAQATSAGATSAALGADLDAVLSRLVDADRERRR